MTTLRFRKINHDTLAAIRSGRKKVETRSATQRYRKLKAGDRVVLVCGKDRFVLTIRRATVFRTIAAMLRRYAVRDIEPDLASAADLRKKYYTYPQYREKIKAHGLIAMELKK